MRGKIFLQGLLVLLLCAVFGVQLGFGAGFGLYEGSARGNALAGTLVGRADDASAVYYNPAGITQLPGIQAMAGTTLVIPSLDVKTRTGSVVQDNYMTDNIWIVPHAYGTFQLTDKVWAGLGIFSQFGLGTQFDDNWPGKYSSYRAFIQSATINPNIAFKVTDNLSLAVGLDFIWLDGDLRQAIPFPRGNQIFQLTDQTLKGNSFGYGANVAIHYKPFEWLALGATYRSQVKEHVTGHAAFSNTNPLLVPQGIATTPASLNITLPDEVFLGATFYPIQKLSVEIGAIWTNWSTWNNLAIQYDNPPIFSLPTGGQVSKAKNWDDAWRFMLGVEYKALDWLDLRAGYAYDQTPVRDSTFDYLVPDSDRHMFSFGPGFHFGKWSFDVSYTYISLLDRSVPAQPANGILPSEVKDGDAHLVGMSVGYKF
jgi:long-chain fatty acid transport protein